MKLTTIILALALILFSACAQDISAPQQSVRPAGASSASQVSQSAFSRSVVPPHNFSSSASSKSAETVSSSNAVVSSSVASVVVSSEAAVSSSAPAVTSSSESVSSEVSVQQSSSEAVSSSSASVAPAIFKYVPYNGTAEWVISATTNAYPLASLDIPDFYLGEKVRRIGDEGFNGKHNLVSVVIGSNITSIGQWSFQQCPKLVSVTFKSTVPPQICGAGYAPFALPASNPALKIYVPASAVTAYQTAAVWKDYGYTILPIPE